MDEELKSAFEGKRIAWVLPGFTAGSGGVQTICRHLTYLQSLGAECHVLVCQWGAADNATGIAGILRESYGCEPACVYDSPFSGGGYDLAIATLNSTVPFARALDTRRCCYFVQDYEPYFTPVGDDYIAAEDSYRDDLITITIGRWLAHKLHEDHGVCAWPTDFSIDGSLYRPLGMPREKAVCAIFQPGKARRCAELVADALELVGALAPDVSLYVYGSDEPWDFRVPVQQLGLVSKDECNRLYNRCSAGLCVSATNPSRIPFEMMAAGLPVVDVFRENTLWDFADGAVALAQPNAAALAWALLEMVSDPARARAAGRAGEGFMADRRAGMEERGFALALARALAGDEPPVDALARSYRAKAVEAPREVAEAGRALRWKRLQERIVAPAIDCPARFVRIGIAGLPADTPASSAHACVWSAPGQADIVWYGAYGREADGICIQVDLGDFGSRAGLYYCQVFARVDGEDMMVAECSLRVRPGSDGPECGMRDVERPRQPRERATLALSFSDAPFSKDLASTVAGALRPVLSRIAPR